MKTKIFQNYARDVMDGINGMVKNVLKGKAHGFEEIESCIYMGEFIIDGKWWSIMLDKFRFFNRDIICDVMFAAQDTPGFDDKCELAVLAKPEVIFEKFRAFVSQPLRIGHEG